MIDSFGYLWDFLTLFFTDQVIYQPLFMALILMNLLFAVGYLLLKIGMFVGGGKY